MTVISIVESRVRAWTAQTMEPRGKRERRPSDRFLVFDTETKLDIVQKLVFGVFTYGAYENMRCIPCVEGLIFADDLPTTDPEGYRQLKRYTRENRARVDLDYIGSATVNPRLVLVPRSRFLKDYLYPLSEGRHVAEGVSPATISGYNLPFDLSRIANDVGNPRKSRSGSSRFKNGFTFEMLPKRARIRIKRMGAKGSLMGFSGGYGKRVAEDGKFVDVANLVSSLIGRPMSLSAAGKRFGIANPKDTDEQDYGVISNEHIGYCRNDVRATMQLYEATMRELYSHDIDLPEHATYSSASIAKAYLDKMGIRRPLEKARKIPQEILGYATSAFYGGRSEVRARREPVPAVLCDFTSMYPTVNILMGLWEMLISRDIVAREETDAVQFLLDNATPETTFDPKQWKEYRGIARVVLNGDVVPVRADHGGGNTTIGLNHAYSDDPRWYAIPDLVQSAVLTGKPPQIDMAYRFYPVGRTSGLQKINVRGVPFDPRTQDFFKYLVETRAELKTAHKTVCATFREKDSCDCEESHHIEFLKVLANSGSYGVFVEMNREDYDDGKERTVYGMGDEPWKVFINRPEKAGHYCFPPLGVLITAGARLMLALLERLVTDAGGSWAFCDTDSMCIIASPHGEAIYGSDGNVIPVLTYDDVERIRMRFDDVNPYDRSKVPHLLKREAPQSYSDPQLWAYGIAAKEYALFRRTIRSDQGREQIEIVKNTEHGLRLYANPACVSIDDERGSRTWIKDVWRYLIELELGYEPECPEWFSKPAMMKRSVSTWNVYRSLAAWNEGRSYQDSIKPYNFHLIALTGAMAGKETLVAPFETDSDKWLSMDWRSLTDPGGAPYTLGSHDLLGHPTNDSERVTTYLSYGSIVHSYWQHPETKYADRTGNTCGLNTRGLLHRRHIRLGTTTYIGKESDRLDERMGGLIIDEAGEPVIEYGSDRDHFQELVVPVLARIPARQIARNIRCSHETAKHNLQAPRRGSDHIRDAMIRYAVDIAQKDMGTYHAGRSNRQQAHEQWHVVLTEWQDLGQAGT